VGFKKLAWRSNQKNLPWGSKSYRGSKEEKKKIYYKKLVESNICGLRYRGGKKVTV